MSESSDKYLFWFKTPPYESLAFREGLDAALAYAAFDQDVALYFDSLAVPALIAGEPSLIDQKDIAKNLKALGMYDIDKIMANEDALTQLEGAGLKPVIAVEKTSANKLSLNRYRNILVF